MVDCCVCGIYMFIVVCVLRVDVGGVHPPSKNVNCVSDLYHPFTNVESKIWA